MRKYCSLGCSKWVSEAKKATTNERAAFLLSLVPALDARESGTERANLSEGLWTGTP
ncbi:hypothetical protein [Streptomyces sp. NPDC056670]|uniref:hypothetical protein n=1 Tax=Streptomyces sp. NPDC056670 TaxID=3345904 RepID=UPI003688CB36